MGLGPPWVTPEWPAQGSFPQNNRQNQISLIIIYHEENIYPNLDYFVRKKSDYVLGFCFTEIINSVF